MSRPEHNKTTSAARLLNAVREAAEHLSYAQIEGIVDGRLSEEAQAAARGHLAHCPLCARELAEMRSFAAELARPPAIVRGAGDDTAPSWWKRLLAGPAPVRALAAVVVVGVAASIVLSSLPDHGPSAARVDRIQPRAGDAGAGSTGAGDTGAGGAGAGAAGAGARFSDSAVGAAARIAPDSAAAYRIGDFAALARILQARADGGESLAQVALGVLYAEGRGVPRDDARARMLWGQAAAKGNAAAMENLRVLQTPR
jgi:TPR repeat protein